MREILLNICMTSIFLCLFKMLFPENFMKKQSNFLIACFFLSSLIFFATAGRINFAEEIGAAGFGDSVGLESWRTVDFADEYAAARSRAVEREINRTIANILAERKIFPLRVRTNVSLATHNPDIYRISITEVRLVFAPPDADSDGVSDEISREMLELLAEAIDIVQKEVGDGVFVSGEFAAE